MTDELSKCKSQKWHHPFWELTYGQAVYMYLLTNTPTDQHVKSNLPLSEGKGEHIHVNGIENGPLYVSYMSRVKVLSSVLNQNVLPAYTFCVHTQTDIAVMNDFWYNYLCFDKSTGYTMYMYVFFKKIYLSMRETNFPVYIPLPEASAWHPTQSTLSLGSENLPEKDCRTLKCCED